MLVIVYVSSATSKLSDAELLALQEQSQKKNEQLGVTGILLHKDGDFMQLFEGPDEAVRNLAKSIYADKRHHHIIQLLERPIAERTFPEWSMQFQDVSTAKLQQLDEFMDWQSVDLACGGEHRSPALSLLASFGFRPEFVAG
jgi:hypothetical protein